MKRNISLPRSHMWSTRTATALAAAGALVMSGGLVMLTAPAASAHTDDIKATAVCQENGTYLVTYKLTTSSVPDSRVGTTMWKIGDTTFAGTPTSNTGLDTGPVTSTGNETVTLGTQELSGDTTTGPWVYAFTEWKNPEGGNFATKGSDTRVENLAGDCAPTTPPPVDCTTRYDFPDKKMWEVTWGHGFADRNGGVPTFTMASNGGLVQLDGAPVPAYMTPDWKWLYVTDGKDNNHTYTFADGTVRTVKVTFGQDADGCSQPTIVWSTQAFEPFIATSHTVGCGTATITLRNHSLWIYPVSYRVDGGEWKYGPVVDNSNGPVDQSGSKTFSFDEDSGTHTIDYVVNAGTESDLYTGKPVGEITTITVQTDCQPNTPPFVPETQVESRTVDGTLDCTAGTVQQLLQQRSRTEVSDGVWGAWSEWTTVTTSTRSATATECPVVAGVEKIAPDVSFKDATCEDPNRAKWSGNLTDLVDYTVSGTPAPGNDITVTATIKPAVADEFAFADGFDNTFDHSYPSKADLNCATVKGSESSRPKPQRTPTVLGTQAVVPTAVDAGLAFLPGDTASSTTSLLAQLMVAGGLLFLLAGGWLGLGRREYGEHQA